MARPRRSRCALDWGGFLENTMFSWLKRTALWIVAIPLLSIYLGAGLNQIVLYKNNDTFPVVMNEAKVNLYHYELQAKAEAGDEEAQAGLALLEHGYLDDTHVIATKDSKLVLLADWIDTSSGIYSIGDVLIVVGEKALGYAPVVWTVVVVGKLSKKEEEYRYR
jgi:hypothetical protein